MATNNKAIESELLELENQYWQAMKEKDFKKAIGLNDNPCLVTGPRGVGSIGPQEFEAMVKSSPSTLRSFKMQNGAQVRLLTNDVAVVAYQMREELTVDGKQVTIDAADTSTWVRRDGRWKCAAHSEALAGDPYGRDRQSAPH